MTVHRAFRTIPTREPTSVGSPDKKEGVAMRYQRLSSWFLGICIAVYVSMLASPATAGVPGITKICPDATLKSAPDTVIGTIWGYVETFAPYIAAGAFLILIFVSGSKYRNKVTGWFLGPVIGLLIVGTVITVLTNLPGTTC